MNLHLLRASAKAGVLVVTTFAILALVDSCVPFKTVARTAIDVANAVCITRESWRSDAEVKQICHIVDALDEPMRELLKSSRERVAQERERVAFSKDVECHFGKLRDVDGGGK